jgi:hypothetical protein
MKSSMTIAIAQSDVPNLIGNFYTKDVIAKMYEKTKEATEKGFFGGELVNAYLHKIIRNDKRGIIRKMFTQMASSSCGW